MAATPWMPMAKPRSSGGKASVMMAMELAKMKAPPTPWPTRMMMIHRAASGPDIQVTERRTEKTVKMAKPRVYMRTRPKMSPTLPKLTTSTEVTSRKPIRIHRKKEVLPGERGLRPMPRKMSGRAMSRIDALMVTIRVPMVVLVRATHL